MTPTEILTAARDNYNAVGDTFFSDTQLLNWLTQACHILAKKAWLIERTYTASTVASTQDYAYPTNTIAIKRITVDGTKISPYSFRQDDSVTLSNSTSLSTGRPSFYTDFNYTLSMRPIPDGVYTIKIYSYSDAQQVTILTALEIPTLFHFDTVDYLLCRMFGKDKDLANMTFYGAEWAGHVKDAIAYKARKKRTDSFATVQDEENLPVNIMGSA